MKMRNLRKNKKHKNAIEDTVQATEADAKYKKEIRKISKFFKMDKVKCSANQQKALKVLTEHDKAGHKLTVLTKNPTQDMPEELKFPFGIPVIVVDPRQKKKAVNKVLNSKLVQKHFHRNEVTLAQFMQGQYR